MIFFSNLILSIAYCIKEHIFISVFACIVLLFLILFIFYKGRIYVPLEQAWIKETKKGAFTLLSSGKHFAIPYRYAIRYKHNLKEVSVDIPEHTVITKDKISMVVKSVMYIKVVEPIKTSYVIENPYYSCIKLVQSSIASYINNLDFDVVFQNDLQELSVKLIDKINKICNTWGINCIRYLILSITPSDTILKAIESKKAIVEKNIMDISTSDTKKHIAMNNAELKKQESLLKFEVDSKTQIGLVNRQVEMMRLATKAMSTGIEDIFKVIKKEQLNDNLALKVVDQSMRTLHEAFNQIISSATDPVKIEDEASASKKDIFSTLKLPLNKQKA